MTQEPPFRLRLMGSFQLSSREGGQVRIPSKKGKALISLVAAARGGERARIWLQDYLWGSRPAVQAQASLRRELANLRAALAAGGAGDLLFSDSVRVGIDLDQVKVDVRALEAGRTSSAMDDGEFLEGFDIPEEGFEEWLRDQRSRLAGLKAEACPPEPATAAEPASRFPIPRC